ncbi:RtcB family protein [Candidatus Woesearchaeota archaeon]|nr:RtcB family protein [Candidatus Woesearchaeota archaeon]
MNCLHPESLVLTRDGYQKKISEFDDFEDHRLKVFELNDHIESEAEILAYIGKEYNKEVFRLMTKTGKELILSSEHPIFTKEGMKELKNLKVGESIGIFPFEGVEYKEGKDTIILREENFDNYTVKELKKRGLLPLKENHNKIGCIARVFGYILGDGYIYRTTEKRKNRKKLRGRILTGACGEKLGLEDLRRDITNLGYKPSKIYERIRLIKGKNYYGNFETNSEEFCIHINSKSFSSFLNKLGMPIGKRDFIEVPKWVIESPKWVKRNFLAGFFGAELSKPDVIKKISYTFRQCFLTIGVNKENRKEGLEFLKQIDLLLKDFDIKTTSIYEIPGTDKTIGLRLVISGNDENLIKLFSKIGYEYNKERQFLSCVATDYLKKKRSYKSALKNRYKKPDFPNFYDYVKEIENSELQKTGMVFEEVKEIKPIIYDGLLYDFTLNHKDHNFIANNIVVSNCGMRLLTTNLTYKDVQPRLKDLVNNLFERVPAGVGSKGFVKLSSKEFKEAVELGGKWCVDKGYGWKEDLEYTEENGCMAGADSSKISDRSIQRGLNQIGTLGSGNHYLEIQRVKEENMFDKETAKKLGFFDDQIVIMFHCGSRGFGHQVATDYLQTFLKVMEPKYGIKILDRELACAPFDSKEGQDYFSAMKCGVNMSFANRQTIAHRIREVFSKVFNQDAEKLGMKTVYDVAHNTAKLEKHKVDGKIRELLVHRKGATRAFGPGRDEIPKSHRDIGQVVIIGGSMETGSYVLTGTEKGMEKTFGSTAHGAGRTMSRTKARGMFRGDKLQKDMEADGIYVKTTSMSGLAEEAGKAYKDVHEVCEAAELAGISKRIISLIPIGNVKG